MIATFSCLHRCGDVKVDNEEFRVAYDTELSEPNMQRLLRFQELPDPEKVLFWSSSDLFWFDEVQFKDAGQSVSKEVLISEVVGIETTYGELVGMYYGQLHMVRKSNREQFGFPFAGRVAKTYATEGLMLAKSEYRDATFFAHEEEWAFWSNFLLVDKEKMRIELF